MSRHLSTKQQENMEDVQENMEDVFVAKRDGQCVMYNQKGEVIPTPSFDDAWPVGYSELVAYKQNGLWGFLNREGQVVVAPRFAQVGTRSERLTMVKTTDQEGGKWGAIGSDGELKIAAQYDDMPFLSWENIVYRKAGKWGLMTQEGAAILPAMYDAIRGVRGGFCVKRGEVWDLLNADHKTVLLGLDEPIVSGSPLLLYKKGGLYGYLNPNFEVVVCAQFEEAQVMCEGRAFVKKTQKTNAVCYYIKDGVEHEVWAEDAGEAMVRAYDPQAEGVIRINGTKIVSTEHCTTDGDWDILDENGEYVHLEPFPYTACGHFTEGVAPVCAEGAWGYVDRDNHWVIRPQFEEARQCKEGYAIVRKDGKDGLVRFDKECSDGFEWAIAPRYEKIDGFCEGICCIQQDGKWGYVSYTGETIVEPVYEEVVLIGNAFRVQKDGLWGLLNKQGETIVEPQFFEMRPLACIPYLFAVRNAEESKTGVIRETGKWIVPMELERIWG